MCFGDPDSVNIQDLKWNNSCFRISKTLCGGNLRVFVRGVWKIDLKEW